MPFNIVFDSIFDAKKVMTMLNIINKVSKSADINELTELNGESDACEKNIADIDISTGNTPPAKR